MKQLPGQRSKVLPRWLKTVMAGAITVIATVWLVSLLPFLLLAALVLSIALIPVTRRLRREMEEAGFSVNEPRTTCLLYTSPSPRDAHESRMPSSA